MLTVGDEQELLCQCCTRPATRIAIACMGMAASHQSVREQQEEPKARGLVMLVLLLVLLSADMKHSRRNGV